MSHFTEKPILITLKLGVRPDVKAAFVDWQAKFNSAVVAYPGFVSLEFLSESQKEWTVIQRFCSESSAASWKNSKELEGLVNEVKVLVRKDGIHQTLSEESTISKGVTEVIVTQINPEKEAHYREWSAKIHQAEAKFPGFRGVYLQSPKEAKGRNWITLLKFDTVENLDRWLNSSERQELLNESISLVSSVETHRIISPFPGWFASIAKVGDLPAAWKQTMVVLLVLFPIVMIELKYLSPLLSGFDLSLSTFIGNAISVALITFPMMPIAIWFLGWWLTPPKRNQQQLTILGTLIVLGLYLIEIAVFWKFF